MKRPILFLLFNLRFTCAIAQGWVNFMNSPATLFSVRNSDGVDVGLHGTYFFSLLTAPPDTADFNQFTFTGVYATNQAVAGRFFGGTFLEVPNWPVGTNKSYLIAGWSGSLGPTWNPDWMNSEFSTNGYFGLSLVGFGAAGGIFDTNRPPLPPLNLFGGATGIQSGFSLYPVGVPEPSSVAVTALGVALQVYLRRCKRSRERLERTTSFCGNQGDDSRRQSASVKLFAPACSLGVSNFDVMRGSCEVRGHDRPWAVGRVARAQHIVALTWQRRQTNQRVGSKQL